VRLDWREFFVPVGEPLEKIVYSIRFVIAIHLVFFLVLFFCFQNHPQPWEWTKKSSFFPYSDVSWILPRYFPMVRFTLTTSPVGTISNQGLFPGLMGYWWYWCAVKFG
jgi:hypothetical protein